MSERDPDIAYLQLLRAWALIELDRMTPEAKEAFRRGSLTLGHPDTDEAVLQYLDHRIGTCEQCGRRAPLATGYRSAAGSEAYGLCAWGCMQ